ncbi:MULTISPECIES: phosphonate ABC transporter, permease protein PhnE [Leisingera]|jgi:phosphonate transport system permease protein|uniref:phosphonate ABC transporter, permease protein PhnE n=1 Tax=Leisingera TaxID=191028 RepID=UPI000B281AAF|nr:MULTISPECIES: phosphonate ABC transporter, permease protein PhnE [Leisingera]QDI74408.1 phosphonate ABC transporter, permease protein PhnE [Leisingera aquaemixtae]
MNRALIWFVLALAILWSVASAEMGLEKLPGAGARLGEFLGRMIPPDLSVWREVMRGLAETLRIAILGTFFAVILSAGLAVLAAETLVPAAVWRPVRGLLAMIRSIPLILVAMLMVGAVGLGPLPGILAITFHATGMLAKFYAEAIDNVAAAPVAALESAGASRAQQLRWAIWPQMAPVILRDTVFRFELNLRESLILGIVGAGGIGLYVQTYVRSFQYDKAATVTLAIVVLVLASEAVNSALHKRYS